MSKYAFTYHKEKSIDAVMNTVTELCEACYTPNSKRALWRLLHVIAYSSVFLVPEHLLTDGYSYSIEDICSYQDGLINSVELHHVLEQIAQLDNVDMKVVYDILINALLPEILDLLHMPIFDVYCALCAAYFLEVGNQRKYNLISNISTMTDINRYRRCYLILTE